MTLNRYSHLSHNFKSEKKEKSFVSDQLNKPCDYQLISEVGVSIGVIYHNYFLSPDHFLYVSYLTPEAVSDSVCL